MSAFITRMKTYREKRNMTQEELAGKVGVRRETILRLEKGRYNPSLKLAADISRELHTSIETVFEFEGHESESRIYIVSGSVAGSDGRPETGIFGVCDNEYDAEQIRQQVQDMGSIPYVVSVQSNRLIHIRPEEVLGEEHGPN